MFLELKQSQKSKHTYAMQQKQKEDTEIEKKI